jgi:predicted nuclease of restriction endonuclease-like (RecB) superfamily
MIKVKIIDENHEKDLERRINDFLLEVGKVVNIQFSTAISIFAEEQIYCFSAMIIYEN